MVSLKMPKRKLPNDEETIIELVEDDEEVEEINERERFVDRVRVQVKKPSTMRIVCKWVAITASIAIFVSILVTLWLQYGDAIRARVFPPSISAMGDICRNGTSKTYRSNLDTDMMRELNTTDFHVNMSVPEHPFVVLFPDAPYRFHESCLITETLENCIRYIVYSM